VPRASVLVGVGLSSLVARAVARELEREALGQFLDELDEALFRGIVMESFRQLDVVGPISVTGPAGRVTTGIGILVLPSIAISSVAKEGPAPVGRSTRSGLDRCAGARATRGLKLWFTQQASTRRAALLDAEQFENTNDGPRVARGSDIVPPLAWPCVALVTQGPH
jgi:hypothetical protein